MPLLTQRSTGRAPPSQAYHGIFPQMRQCTFGAYSESHQGGVPLVLYNRSDAELLPMMVFSQLDWPKAQHVTCEAGLGESPIEPPWCLGDCPPPLLAALLTRAPLLAALLTRAFATRLRLHLALAPCARSRHWRQGHRRYGASGVVATLRALSGLRHRRRHDGVGRAPAQVRPHAHFLVCICLQSPVCLHFCDESILWCRRPLRVIIPAFKPQL